MDRLTKSQTEEVAAEAKYLPMTLSHHVLKAAASEGASLASRAKFASSGQVEVNIKPTSFLVPTRHGLHTFRTQFLNPWANLSP
jgi:hypothetical protein